MFRLVNLAILAIVAVASLAILLDAAQSDDPNRCNGMYDANAARDDMMAQIAQGATSAASSSSSANANTPSAKVVLIRGCDPVMAQRAGAMLPPLLDNARIVSCTTDDELLSLLHSGAKFDVVFFAPGACRYSAAAMPIPGGNAKTRGWSLTNYRAAVREALGTDAVPIVETADEREIVPLLRRALGIDA
jgi:hypothetical protein